jgi:RND family efflux transporter MFP subunit
MSEPDINKLKIDKTQKLTGPSRRKKKPFFIALAIALLLILGILYTAGIIAPATTIDVTTVTQVYPAQSLSVLNASGYIVAERKAAVASKTTGRLVALMVEEGSKVKKGQIIARMESDDVTAAKNQAAANLVNALAVLEQAKTDRDIARRENFRYQGLEHDGSVSQSDWDAINTRYKRSEEGVKVAEANVLALRAALEGAKAGLDYTLIRAPFDAVVLTKNADVGDIVTPFAAVATAKAAVVTIADMRSLLVEVDVSETNIVGLRTGQACDIQLDALPAIRFRGEVYTIVPTVDRTKATVLVKVRFLDKDPRMLPDMSAKVSFLSRNLKTEERKPRLAVNGLALVGKTDQTHVFVLQGNHVQETSVQTGVKLGDMIEMISGLKSGDRVVINPPKGMKNGTKIKIAER